MTKIRKNTVWDSIKSFILLHKFAIVVTLIYFIVINLVTLNRFWQYETFYFDHGIYDQALWSAAHSKPPMIDHLDKTFTNQLADHFSPSLYLLIPLYWITSAYEPIIIIQNFFFAFSAIVLYVIAWNKIGSKLMSFALLSAYALFIGLQNSVISFFHADFIGIFSLSLALYFMEKRKWIWYCVFLLITFGAKESYPAVGVGIGIYLFFTKNYRQSIFTILISILYYFIAVNIAVPYIGHTAYIYKMNSYNLPKAVEQFFYPLIKTRTLLLSFATFGLLPLSGVSFLPAILQDYFVRFVLINTSARWDLGLHYNGLVSVLLFYGSIVGVMMLKKNKFYAKRLLSIHAILIILIALVFHYKLQGPLGLSYNLDFYKHTKDMKFLNTFVKRIPNDGLVFASNNIAPHLTHTHTVMLYRIDYKKYNPQVIAIDNRDGQNPNNYWPLPPFQFQQLVSELESDPNYTPQKVFDFQTLYIRKK